VATESIRNSTSRRTVDAPEFLALASPQGERLSRDRRERSLGCGDVIGF
jgi:hypothetical protein